MVVGALLAALPVARIYRSFNDLKTDDRSSYNPVFQGSLFLLVICLIFYSNWWINVPEKFQPIPGQDMMELATFVRENLPADAVYLAFTQDGDAEWFPYLLQRTPAIGTWGAEWLGTYSENLGLVFDVNDCINGESYECVDMQLQRLQNKPGYLITTTANDIINKGLQAEMNWQTIFQNQLFILWKVASN